MPSTSSHPAIYIALWIGLAILVPSIPVVLTIAVFVLQGTDIILTKLFDGIELFLLSLTLIAATLVELSRTNLNWANKQLLSFFIRAILVLLAALSLILLTMTYIDIRLVPLQFDRELNIRLALGFFLLVGIFTGMLQSYIGYSRYKNRVKEIET